MKIQPVRIQKNRLSILLVIVVAIFISSIVGSLLQLTQNTARAATSRVQQTTCTNNGATTIGCTALSTSPVNGNLLVAVIGTRGTTANRVTLITQTGATWVMANQATNASGVTLEVWYATNVASAGTGITVNLAASLKVSAVVAEYSGMLTSSVLDKTDGAATGNSGTASAGTTTTTTTATADQLWIGGMANINTDTYSAQTNSFTEVSGSSFYWWRRYNT